METNNANTASSILKTNINQRVAILIDGNNIEIAIHDKLKSEKAMINYKTFIPKLITPKRELNRLYYFREGNNISPKLAKLLHEEYFGVVVPCGKSVDIHLTITATELSDKVDTIIICSGDGDYLPLIKHLKSRAVRVEIACIVDATSKKLIEEADHFIEIKDEDCYTYKPKQII